MLSRLVGAGVALVILGACACATSKKTQKEALQPRTAASEPRSLKIGVIADSQIQTLDPEGQHLIVERLGGDRHQRELADKLSRVAIRQPAQDVGAGALMRHGLRTLQHQKVDFVVFLGDLSNNGCEDELNSVEPWCDPGATHFDCQRGALGAVSAFVSETQVPVFVALGNHDYLDSGVRPRRGKSCGVQPPLFKKQVIERMAQVNRASFEVLKRKIPEATWEWESLAKCPGSELDDLDRQCVLTTVLRIGDAFTIALLDTSDYQDTADFLTKSVYGSLGARGFRGGISFKGDQSQSSQLAKYTGRDDFLILASHFPYRDLDKWGPGIEGGGSGNLEAVYKTRMNSRRDVWLSGHSHHSPTTHNQYTDGDELPIVEWNFGSTTDGHTASGAGAQAKYLSPSVAVVTLKSTDEIDADGAAYARAVTAYHFERGDCVVPDSVPVCVNYRVQSIRNDAVKKTIAYLSDLPADQRERAAYCVGLISGAIEDRFATTSNLETYCSNQ